MVAVTLGLGLLTKAYLLAFVPAVVVTLSAVLLCGFLVSSERGREE